MRARTWGAWWLAACGTWPLVDSGHAGRTLGSLVDLGVHAAGVAYLGWRLLRRCSGSGGVRRTFIAWLRATADRIDRSARGVGD